MDICTYMSLLNEQVPNCYVHCADAYAQSSPGIYIDRALSRARLKGFALVMTYSGIPKTGLLICPGQRNCPHGRFCHQQKVLVAGKIGAETAGAFFRISRPENRVSDAKKHTTLLTCKV